MQFSPFALILFYIILLYLISFYLRQSADSVRFSLQHHHTLSNNVLTKCNKIFFVLPTINAVRAICMSILSMLSSCTKKERPPDDDRYNKKNPKKTRFVYHDDSV